MKDEISLKLYALYDLKDGGQVLENQREGIITTTTTTTTAINIQVVSFVNIHD